MPGTASSDRNILPLRPERRIGRMVMYAGITVSGLLGVFYPIAAIEEAVSNPLLKAWTLAIILSAAFCFWGSVTGRWLGEYSALPLLVASLFLCGIVVYSEASSEATYRYAYGILIMSYACGLGARWKDVRKTYKASKEASQQGN